MFQPKIYGADVCVMMALMKNVRIEAIEKKLFDIYSGEIDGDGDIVDTLKFSMRDSIADRDNYLWIADNYDKYKEL